MNRKKKRWMICATACLAIGMAALALISMPMSTQAAEPNSVRSLEYEYALLGETYFVESGFLGGTTPLGEKIDKSVKSVFLDWASGSYLFEYSTRTVNLKVYERSPEDHFSLEAELPTNMVTGKQYQLPKASIISGINRTDAAPSVGSYSYSMVVKGDEGTVASFQEDEPFQVVFKRGGEYTLSYEYVNVFEESKAFEQKVYVTDQKTILFDLADEYCVGELLALSKVYGSFMGVNFPASVQVTTPSGKILSEEATVLCNEVGEYTLSASCSFGEGSAIHAEKKITVINSLGAFLAEKKSMADGKTVALPESCISNERTALLLKSVGTGLAASYHGVVDLREFGREDAFISVIANLNTTEGITGLKITLTDIYDSNNKLSINILKNCDRNSYESKYTCDNATINVSYGSVSTAFNNYYPLKEAAVGWNTTFHPVWVEKAYQDGNSQAGYAPFMFSYDTSTNKMYAYGKYNTIGRPEGDVDNGTAWYLLADLEEKSLPVKFNGFTTGEVYLRVEATGGVGDIALINFGGKTVSTLTERDYQTETDIMLGNFDNSVDGVVGKPYPLPILRQSHFAKSAIVAELRDPNGEILPYSSENFIPQKSGQYTVIYRVINAFGFEVSKQICFEIVQEATPIQIQYDVPMGLKSNDVYEIQEPTIVGGNGDVTYSMRFNGKNVFAGEFVRIGRTFRLEIVATDAFGNTAVENIEAEIDTAVISVQTAIPRSAAAGSKFVAPAVKIYSWEKGEYVEKYTVKINGTQATETIMPKVGEKIVVEYVTDYGSKSFEVFAVAPVFMSGADVLRFSGSGSAETFRDGTEATVSEKETISFPYALSANELNLEIMIRAYDFGKVDAWGKTVYELTYNSLVYTLTGTDGRRIVIELRNLKNDEINVYINGKDTGRTIGKVRGSYEKDESLGDWSEATYYKIVLQYDDVYRILFSGKQFVSNIEKDSDGVSFNGFGSGVFLDVSLGGFNRDIDTASIVFTRISNQNFGTSAFRRGDIVGPAIYSDGVAANRTLEYGTTVNLSSITGYDVLSGVSATTVEFISPNGEKLSVSQNVTLNIYGAYVIKVTLTDGNGKTSSYMYTYIVQDSIPPELSVNGMEDKIVELGSNVTVKGAMATDNIALKRIYVTVCRPDYKMSILTEGTSSLEESTFLAAMKGVYKVQYFAVDVQGNISSAVYTVTVR